MNSCESERLRDLIRLGTEIAEVKDLDVLMERILHSARDFMGCDAGSIYIREGDTLHFSYAQNDTLASRLAPGEKLIYTTFSMPIAETSIAGHVALAGEQLNIPDAYTIPADVPYGFDRSFDESADYRTRSILTVPLKTQTGAVIGVLQLINALDADGAVTPFDPGMEPYVEFLASHAAVALERAQLTRTIILRMISMAELRDPTETGSHVNRVAGYAVEIYETWAKKRGIPGDEINKTRDTLRMAAMLHDVGKVAISDTILKKPGRLTDDEFDIMKLHTMLGARLFSNPASEFDTTSRDVALNHHERWDGGGYPGYIDPATGDPLPGHVDADGHPVTRHGDEIPLFGRIVALADVYDALSSRRTYKDAWTEEKVLGVIREERGRHFDPDVVDAFIASLPAIREIGRRYQ